LSEQARIRDAAPADIPLLFAMIEALAEYERARDRVVGTPELLEQALFGHPPAAEAVLAEVGREPAGFALFHGTFSTWECRPGIWLEDLFVPPERRRDGVGGALLRHLAAVAVQRGCARLEWAALDWNAPALSFYEKLDADVLDEWKLHRLSGEALRRLAS
jgi:GNAT superfamily N-acetyltransferase